MVEFAAAPADAELFLFDAVLDPVEAHVNGLGSFELGAFVCEAVCGGVVGGDLAWSRLGAAEFCKDLADVDSFLAVVEEGSNFSFAGGGHYVLEYAAFDMDGSIGRGVV
jgi:hypothetical protein